MNRVTKRAGILLVFMAVLLGGLTFFLWEFFAKSADWVTFPGSPHVYADSSTGTGIITDREGTLLLDTRGERTYAEDPLVRQATLHWLGDRQGNISTQVLGQYAKEMAGFDYLNGVYAYGDAGAVAELTLSSRVQAAALKAMAGRKGTVAVYNYRTGEILCALTTPTYDPDNVPDIAGDTSGKYEGAYLNRFTQSTYIPGSIFKIVTTAAVLDSVPDIETRTFTCTGVYAYGVDRVTCERAHGTLDLREALARSCNCAFAQISELLGPETMTAYVEQFGITRTVTFDGITTVPGNYDVTAAAPVELAWSCIGQYTDQINPCAYLTFLGAIAGGGEAAEPYLVEQIQVGKETTYRAKTKLTGKLMPEDLAEKLQAYLRNNVETVYGDEHFPGLTVCAKSGTSQLGGGQVSNAMFAGFLTDADYPLAFLVVVENGGYGSSACVPVLSQVLAECKAVLDGK